MDGSIKFKAYIPEPHSALRFRTYIPEPHSALKISIVMGGLSHSPFVDGSLLYVDQIVLEVIDPFTLADLSIS